MTALRIKLALQRNRDLLRSKLDDATLGELRARRFTVYRMPDWCYPKSQRKIIGGPNRGHE